jgi:hypothetical protein
MNAEPEIAELQRAANQVMLVMRLRTAGILSLLFGFIAVLTGVHSGGGMFGLASMAIGSVLVLVGALVFALPTVNMLVVSGIAMAVIAVWNIAAFWIAHNSILAVLGILQLKSGVDRFSDFKRISAMRIETPSAESLDFMFDAVKRVVRGVPGTSERLVQMRVKGMTWRILLAHKVGILVARGGAALIVRSREDLDILRAPSRGKSRLVQVTGEVIGDIPASMSEQHFEVYRNWRRSAGKRRS